MSVRIGIDGGQSSLRLGVAGEQIRVQAPGFSYDEPDPYAALVEAIARAWEQAGRAEPVEVAVLGLSGAPAAPGPRGELAAAVATAIGARQVWISGDVSTAHAGAFTDGHGVVLAAGTGTVCLGIDGPTGASRRVDGWGHLFGDCGSAFATGRAGVAAALQGHDGRGPATCLTEVLTARCGAMERVPEFFYTSPTRVADVARFALQVAAAAADDEVAGSLIRRTGRDLAHTVRTAAGVIRGGRIPLVVLGRWLTVPAVREAFTRALADMPRIELRPAAGDGVDGACRLAAAPDLGPYAPFFDGNGAFS